MSSRTERYLLVAVALVARLAALALTSRFPLEGDESMYFGAAHRLLTQGVQDVFWPPLTSWIIAALAFVVGERVLLIRAAFLIVDVITTLMIHDLGFRATAGIGDEGVRLRLARIAGFVYALYLPAIGFAVSMTSEAPTVFLIVLATRTLLIGEEALPARIRAALMFGFATLARSNLLLLPFAIAAALKDRRALAIVAFVALASLAPLSWVARNAVVGEGFTIATNSSFNLYVGNIPEAQQELDLFSPRATEAQRELRAGGDFVDAYVAESLSPKERTRRALGFIRDDPGRFMRRALGRLARIFAPKTAHLSLIGGSRGKSLRAPAPAALLLGALAQWVPLLFGGMIGLAKLLESRAVGARLLLATFIGALPLCLVAIAKPRYAFPFEPALMIGLATTLVLRVDPRRLSRTSRIVLGLASAFLLWGFVASFVFAATSRA